MERQNLKSTYNIKLEQDLKPEEASARNDATVCTFQGITALRFALLTEKKHRNPSCAEEL